jgi:hypothetical protein
MIDATVTNFDKFYSLGAAESKAGEAERGIWIDKVIKAQTGTSSLWAALPGVIIAALGAYKQYEMYAKMGDLAVAQQKMVDSQRERYEKLMDTVSLPNMVQARANLWGYALPYAKNITSKVVDCATAICNYNRRPTNTSAAAASVARIMSGARRTSRRASNPRATGVCCDNDARLAAVQAQLLASNVMLAERYEDEVEFKHNQFYWSRMLGGGQMAQRMAELSGNLAQGAATQLSSVLGGINTAIELGQGNARLASVGLNGQAGVFGGLGSLGGVLAGNAVGSMSGNNILRTIFGGTTPGDGGGVSGGFSSSLSDLQAQANAGGAVNPAAQMQI